MITYQNNGQNRSNKRPDESLVKRQPAPNALYDNFISYYFFKERTLRSYNYQENGGVVLGNLKKKSLRTSNGLSSET